MMSTDSLSPSPASPSSSRFGRGGVEVKHGAAGDTATADSGIAGAIRGDRGPAWVKRGTSIQSKVQNALALAVVALLGGGFLLWYYSRVATVPPPAEETRAKAAAAGEMALPPLGPPLGPSPMRPAPVVNTPLVEAGSPEEKALLKGEPDDELRMGDGLRATSYPVVTAPPPPDPVRQRRLEAPVLIRGTGSYAASVQEDKADALSWTRALDGQGRPQSVGLAGGPGSESGSALAGMLRPTRTAAVAAGVTADRRFLLPKGAFIDCTLETAIDSSLPGMTTCITATDVWSADGSVVLLERGTKLVGETRGEVRQGQERLFVLWSEARTPAGVIVELASAGTDALGRSGVTGEVDTHFAARFGAAILISLIDAGTAALVASQSNGNGSVVIAPQGASDVVSEVLRQTVNVPPTIRVAQGGRMQVLVARDVSFADVYSLARR